jgi:hypothetical protein
LRHQAIAAGLYRRLEMMPETLAVRHIPLLTPGSTRTMLNPTPPAPLRLVRS